MNDNRPIDPKILVAEAAEVIVHAIFDIAQDEPDAIDGFDRLAEDMRNRIHELYEGRAGEGIK